MFCSCEGSSHNNLRLSRILKCLSEFNLEHLNVGFLLHVLCEQSESHHLNSSGIQSSMDRWWANCIRDEDKRKQVGQLIRKVRSQKDGYVFTREMYKAVVVGPEDVAEGINVPAGCVAGQTDNISNLKVAVAEQTRTKADVAESVDTV